MGIFPRVPGLSHHSLSAISDALSFGRHAASDDDTDLRQDGLEKSSAQTFISRSVPPDQKVQGDAMDSENLIKEKTLIVENKNNLL